ncbi:NADP-binding protein [Dacryopinax primogenitus]|uniref:NADP-binding protein n=1 Tax=Dacryopinax primogenitus (strain DJM 731) TaxID=1858805 RepID=M5GDU2_DACPD|nr:NADP-binding protein [Dacryopinax primogenitus]EJU04842.1 NADP-binding protein [Dacryopinax primogenitus]
MPTWQAVRAANATYHPSFRPVALFVGGTSGLGQATAESLARYTNSNVHIILCGRNKEAAEKIIASLPQTEGSKYEFVKCEATMMDEIAKVSADLRERLPKLNYLFLSQGILTMKGRTETTEGIDRKLALHLYGRWKFVFELMPLLDRAKGMGEEARVVTVLSAGGNGKVIWDDLDLKKNYSLVTAKNHATTGNDIMVDEMARRYPNISFTHMYPGGVRTPIITGGWIGKALLPLTIPLTESPAQASEWLVHPLLSEVFAKGAFYLDNHADDAGANKWSTEETRKSFYDHVRHMSKMT